ncbi:MAG: hypothetical protein HY576_07470 [candidate division NC10 bacterium]|nr:hypothetical protein [candidate division NC10 bacterium]
MRLRERFSLARLLWVAVLTLLVPAAWAAEDDLDGKAAALDRGATTREAKSAIFTKFYIPTTDPITGTATVYAGMPPGQALVLFSLCGPNAACQTQALADRQAHMGWGKVAEDLVKNCKDCGLTNDKVGQAVRQVTDAHRDLAAKAEKPEKPEKLEKMQRMERPEHPGRPGR